MNATYPSSSFPSSLEVWGEVCTGERLGVVPFYYRKKEHTFGEISAIVGLTQQVHLLLMVSGSPIGRDRIIIIIRQYENPNISYCII